ncbi:MAG: phosphatidylserine decarboxylase [Streptosporangiaceae bacterium]|nr:phosphatidylserine decarboxylase [Streptosporangiaceae bacterium]
MWTAGSLRVAARYVLPPLLAGTGLAAAGRRGAAAAALAAAAGITLFFRDPGRFPDPCEPGVVYAVTDGKVVLVGDGVHVPWLPGGPYRQVSVFLSLADVHVAWSPVSGKMVSWTWLDGKCRAAMLRAAEEGNRQSRITIETGTGGDMIGVVLAAGLIARRITQWALPGVLLLGRRLAIIHFGSRCVMYVPQARYELLAARGDRLTAGVSPVARRLTA